MKLLSVVFVVLMLLVWPSAAVKAETTYTITATAASGGTVAPNGAVIVKKDADVTFTITPDPGYEVKNIVTAGVSEGAATHFAYHLVRNNYTMRVFFIKKADDTPETIYVDGRLTEDCTKGQYSIARRDDSGRDGNAYASVTRACDVAGPGDKILIRVGTYGPGGARGAEAIWPKHSGTAKEPILIRPYNNEKVVIGDDPGGSWPNDLHFSIARGAISMRNVHYITIENLVFRNVGGWLFARNCSHVTVRNCTFADARYGAKGGFRLTDCDHWTISGNTFTNSSFDAMALVKSDYNVIEHNAFTTAKHSLLAIRSGSYNVIRNNTFKNACPEKLTEIFDQKVDTRDTTNPLYIAIPAYDGTQHNLLEGNFFGYMVDRQGLGARSSAIQFSGQHTIIRNNVFSNPAGRPSIDPNHYPNSLSGGVALNMRWGGSWEGWNKRRQKIVGEGHEAGYVTHNRIYNNTFYGYDGGKITLPGDTSMSRMPNPPPMKNVENYLDYPFTEPYAFEDNVFKNNIFSEGRIHAYINWTYIKKNEGKGVQLFIMGRVQVTSFESNDFFSSGDYPDELIYNHADYPYQPAKTPAFYNAHYALWSGNVEQDPLYVDADSNDFRLQSTSKLIDAGGFLTAITSPAGSGRQIEVEDTGYFYDGYGIDGEQGDLVKLENGQTAWILNIDYDAGRITLDRRISWTRGEKVSLYYEGAAPDIGAYEYTPRAAADPALSGTTVASGNHAPRQGHLP